MVLYPLRWGTDRVANNPHSTLHCQMWRDLPWAPKKQLSNKHFKNVPCDLHLELRYNITFITSIKAYIGGICHPMVTALVFLLIFLADFQNANGPLQSMEAMEKRAIFFKWQLRNI